MSTVKSFSQQDSSELQDLEAMACLKNFERSVNNVMLSEIPDEEIDYWMGQLKRSYVLLLNSRQPAFKQRFLIPELKKDMDVLLNRLAKRKRILNALSTKTENNSDKKSSNTDIQQEASKVGVLKTAGSSAGTVDDFVRHKDISLELTEFHGKNFEEWLKFSKAFTELVHNNAQMPISTKLNFLREKIKNKPRKLISYMIAETDSNYELAWETLEKRYGNRRIQFTSKLDCLLDMKTMQSDNYLSVQKMHDTAKECIYLMKKHLDRDIGESADEIFAHLIIRKMDVSGRALYEQHVRKTKSIQKLQDVLEFLDQQAEILENLEEISNENTERNIRSSKIDGPC